MRNKFRWFVVLGWAICLLIACSIGFKQAETYATHEHKPASVAKHEVTIIYRGDFGTDDDFYKKVTAQVEYLNRHGYEVFKLHYEYEKDMTQNLTLRFAVLKYKEKNE